METKEYFKKVMQDYNQHRKGHSLRKYCKEEGVDYDWLIEYKKNYPPRKEEASAESDLNGYVMYEKWFDDGRFLKPTFEESKTSHRISRETLILLLSTAVQYKLVI